MLVAVSTSPSALAHLPPPLAKRREFCLAAVGRAPVALRHVHHELRGERSFLLDAVARNARCVLAEPIVA
eukprot:SAG11_NODE_21175_length_430_cov_1.090634_1_plen_69_part_01